MNLLLNARTASSHQVTGVENACAVVADMYIRDFTCSQIEYSIRDHVCIL